MVRLFSCKAIKQLKDETLRRQEKERLDEMSKHALQREQEAHHDFLSQTHAAEELHSHAHRIESHGVDFWSHYYEGERPFPILRDDLIVPHKYGGSEEQQAVIDHLLTPELAEATLPTDGVSKIDMLPQILSKQRWLDYMRVGEAALKRKEYLEAEQNFRVALDEAKQGEQADLFMGKAMLKLARTLSAQGRDVEAATFRSKAAEFFDLYLKATP